MLRWVNIKKFLLIRNTEIEFGKGINVITGESGTGKSMIIEAISFVLGKKGNYEEGTYVEIELDTGDEEPLIIGREIKGGRSRFYINGRTSTFSAVSETVKDKILIHGQNDHLSLFRHDYRRDILDEFAGLIKLRDELCTYYDNLTDLKKKYDALKEEMDNFMREKEIMESILTEIESVGLSPDEYETVKREIEDLAEKERLGRSLENILNDLYYRDNSLYNTLSKIISELKSINDKDVSSFSEGLELFKDKILEGVKLLSSKIPDIDYSSIDELNEKIYRIQLLERRNRKPYREIYKEVKAFKERLKDAEDLERELLRLEMEIRRREGEVLNMARDLSKRRREAVKEFKKGVTDILKALNLEDAVFDVDIKEGNLTRYGIDRIEFLFNSVGGEPKSLEEVVSGGELSRLAFALALLKPPAGTYIFDEVDTGISGETSLKLARMIRRLAGKNQIIIITHSAPIAACGDVFFVTSKGREGVSVRKLSQEERIEEIARLMGIKSESTLRGAEELLEEVRS